MSLLVILLNAITGFFVVRLAWPNGARFCRHDLLRASLGAGLGLGLSSLVTFFADAFFGGGAAVVLGADIVLFAAAASCIAWRRNGPCRFCVRSAAPGGFVLYGCAAAAVTAAMAAFVLFTLNNPYGEWDAWAIWNNHARFLASGPAWKQMFSPHIPWAVQDYPLLIPGAIANGWLVTGSTPASTPALVAFLFLLGAAGVLFGTLDLLRGRKQALVAVVTLFGAGAMVRMSASQYADIPVAFFYLAASAMVCLADVFVEDRHSWWLVGAFAGCAAWTKNEGLVFLAVVVLARVVVSLRFRRFDPKALALMAVGAAPFGLTVAWFKIAIAPANYLFAETQQPLAARLIDISRYMTVAVEFGRQAFTFGGWLLPPVLVLAAYLWLMGRPEAKGQGQSAALITVCAMLAAYAGVYVVTTKDLNWQLDTSLARVLMQLWPAAVLVLFLYAREIREPAAVEAKVERRGKEKGR